MSTWYRVFGASAVEPAPAALLEMLQGIQAGATGRFSGDSEGWFKAELAFPPESGTIVVGRFLSSEDGIREELNSWAAWIETNEGNPYRDRLMRHMIGTAQVFTLLPSTDDDVPASVCVAMSRFLARATDGVYQVDRHGFFAADGSLLFAEAQTHDTSDRS
jgi:hypothetical protein